MGENTKIEWAHHTFNPWLGCTKVSPACDHCYAEAWAKRTGKPDLWKGVRQLTSQANWQQPRKWNFEAFALKTRYRVFCASLADVFDAEVSIDWRNMLFELIAETPHLDWLLLTKRPNIALNYMASAVALSLFNQFPVPNIWLGTTVEDQKMADMRIPLLLEIPAAKHFLSIEPLLGEIDITGYLYGSAQPCAHCPKDIDCECGPCLRSELGGEATVDWLIVGGESGPGARPMHPGWARSLRDQCQTAGVPFFFKQWGEWAPNIGAVDGWTIDDHPEISRFDHREWEGGKWGDVFRPMWCDFQDGNYDEKQCVSRLGKKRTGRMLDGRSWDEVPA